MSLKIAFRHWNVSIPIFFFTCWPELSLHHPQSISIMAFYLIHNFNLFPLFPSQNFKSKYKCVGRTLFFGVTGHRGHNKITSSMEIQIHLRLSKQIELKKKPFYARTHTYMPAHCIRFSIPFHSLFLNKEPKLNHRNILF